MRVDVPILHPLDPVDAAVVFAERLVDVASLVVVVVHVGVQFSQTVTRGAGEEAFNHVTAHVVQVAGIVVEDRSPVVGVHDLAARLGTPVLVQQWAEGRGAGNGDDGLQVFTALCGGFPSRGAFVGFAVNGDVPVAPVLRSQPLNCFVDALAFSVATVVEATRAFLGGEHGHLCESVPVGNKIVVDEFTAPCADNVGRAGLTAGRPVIEIGADDGDDGDLLTDFRVGRKPVRKVNFGRVWTAFPGSGRVHLDERLLHRQGLMGAVLEHASVGARPVPLHGVTFPDAGVHALLFGAGRGFGLAKTAGQRHGKQQDGEHQRLSHGTRDERVHHQHDASPQPLRRGIASSGAWNRRQRGVHDGFQPLHPWPSATWRWPPRSSPLSA